MGEGFICGEYIEINPAGSKGVYIGSGVALSQEACILYQDNELVCQCSKAILKGPLNTINLYDGREYSIVIEDNVWIAAHSIILPGARIGKGSIIAAGSVVFTEIPPYSIVAGNPARVIGNRQKNRANLERKLLNVKKI